MTENEYTEARERVNKYWNLKNIHTRLKFEHSIISSGVLSITAFYKREIDCCGRHEGFQTGICDTLLELYDNEIAKIEKQMEEI